MKTFCLTLIICFLFYLSSCKGQSKKEENPFAQAGGEQELWIPDSLSKPKFKSNVNRRYDKNGNLVQYDSTYTYSYSGPAGKISGIPADSLFQQFRSGFGRPVPGFFDWQFPGLRDDSLFKDPFFDDGLFRKQWEFHRRLFDQFFWPMDSLNKVTPRGNDSRAKTS